MLHQPLSFWQLESLTWNTSRSLIEAVMPLNNEDIVLDMHANNGIIRNPLGGHEDGFGKCVPCQLDYMS